MGYLYKTESMDTSICTKQSQLDICKTQIQNDICNMY